MSRFCKFARSTAKRRKKSSRRGLQLESLEGRRVFATDFQGAISIAGVAFGGEKFDRDVYEGGGPMAAEGESVAADDLVAFAKALANSGTTLYCQAWDAVCADQQRLFEDGSDFLPYVEAGTPARGFSQVAIAEGIETVPTWSFPDGTRATGLQDISQLVSRSRVAMPQSSLPFLAPIADQVVLSGSPMHVAVNAYDPNGGALAVRIEIESPALLSGRVLYGNRSLQLSTDYGDMVFELFEGRAARPAARTIELAQSGFYDGLTFHRIFERFVIQGGDPLGDGTGGSSLGNFDDQFHLALQHNATGILSYAKSRDDTNNSQFFITEGPQRHLDFNHSVFGMLVEGERARELISQVATDPTNRPVYDVKINKATVIDDVENSTIVLLPIGAVTGATRVTVTVEDADGNQVSQTFQVTVEPDTYNSQPFLEDIVEPITTENTPVHLQLGSVDREGDAVRYYVESLSQVPYGLSLDSSGLVTITPPTDYVGELSFVAVVQPATVPVGSFDNSRLDFQVVTVRVRSSHQNAPNRLDVNGDNSVDPIDALIVINFLNGTDSNGAVSSLASPPYRDVNGDLFVTPADVLLIVNYLNAEAGGEGELSFGDPHDTRDPLENGLFDASLGMAFDWAHELEKKRELLLELLARDNARLI